MTRIIERLVEATWFHRGIVAVIVLAGIVAGLETSPAILQRHGPTLHAVDMLILGIFTVEALLKMAAHGRRPWLYFADGWNVFDFLIIVICVLPVGGPFAAVLRLARALRLLRLVSTLPKLQLLVGALLKSLGAMGYVTLLLALMFYIYGVAGIHLFGAHDPKNFGSLPAAFLSLFRLVTLDNWADLFSAQVAHVSALKVTIYFVTFIVFGTMIILNLFIGIIMNSMSEMHAEMEARDRARHEKELGYATFMDEFNALEQQVDVLKEQMARLKCRLAHQPNAGGKPARSPKEYSHNSHLEYEPR